MPSAAPSSQISSSIKSSTRPTRATCATRGLPSTSSQYALQDELEVLLAAKIERLRRYRLKGVSNEDFRDPFREWLLENVAEELNLAKPFDEWRASP